jgi:RNA polymerase sigma-70 factor (ECF subfamily)
MTDPASRARASETFPPDPASPELLLTSELLHQAKLGDPAALGTLVARYLPRLKRWASGRLPRYARSVFETTDLVNEVLLKAIEKLDRIEERAPGAFQAYVRQAILNRIKDEIRWAQRRSGSSEISETLADARPSPLENAIGADLSDRFERACERLTEEERILVHLRIELDFGYEEIAAITDRPSADAARMAVRRSVRKLAEIMGHER